MALEVNQFVQRFIRTPRGFQNGMTLAIEVSRLDLGFVGSLDSGLTILFYQNSSENFGLNFSLPESIR